MDIILFLIIYIGLFIKGFHAITRADKLFSFIGFDETLIDIKIDKIIDRIDEAEGDAELICSLKNKKKELISSKSISKYSLKNVWSECTICMSSFWSMFLVLFIYKFGIITLLIMFPIVVAGFIKMFEKSKNN